MFKDSFVQMYSLNQENVALLIELTYRKNIWCTAPSDRVYNLLVQIFEPSCHGFDRIRLFETPVLGEGGDPLGEEGDPWGEEGGTR